jgi:hypothetical protein
MQIVSPGRMPMAHMIRACALAMARQSFRPTPKAVGRPVVPLVHAHGNLAIGTQT